MNSELPRHRRYKLIKRVYELRCEQLEAARQEDAHPHAYGYAVAKYDRARKRWRRIRGWE